MPKEKKKVYIETLGCQMNMADSERMLGMLDEIDYEETDSFEKADLSVLNTCSIREHAVDKMRSYVGRWEKKRKPGSLIAVAGCVSQQEGNKLIKQIAADIVVGTHNIHRLPDLVLQAQGSGEKVSEVWEELPELIPETPVLRKTKYHAWVNIIYGCNYRCTYCIVPKTRGDQRSRPIDEIKKEIEGLATEGYQEVMLLGQNVDGYGLDIGSNLAELLRAIHPIDGIERIKFLTSHPCDMTYDLIETVAELDKVSKYFHIPVQAGNNEILRRMARRYTRERYMDLINYIRKLMPDASITGDIIVGFPGETHEQFMDSVSIVQEAAYDACNTAVYSPRPYTPAATWEDPISAQEKTERIRYINSVINEVAEKQALRYLGREEDIMVEGLSQRNKRRLAGRIFNNKTTNIEVLGISDNDSLSDEQAAKELEKYFGKILKSKITKAHAWALRAEYQPQEALLTV